MISSTEDLRTDITKFLGTNDYKLLHMHQKGGDLDEIYHVYFEEAEKKGDDGDAKDGSRKYRFGRRGR